MIPEGASGLTCLVDPGNLVVKVEATATLDLLESYPLAAGTVPGTWQLFKQHGQDWLE